IRDPSGDQNIEIPSAPRATGVDSVASMPRRNTWPLNPARYASVLPSGDHTGTPDGPSVMNGRRLELRIAGERRTPARPKPRALAARVAATTGAIGRARNLEAAGVKSRVLASPAAVAAGSPRSSRRSASAAVRSVAFWYRRRGSFSRHRATHRSTLRGVVG